MVTKAEFYFILSFMAGFEAEKIKDFEQLLDGHGKGIINYAKFLALLDDPNEILHLEKKESHTEKDSDKESRKKGKSQKDKGKHEKPEQDGSVNVEIEVEQPNSALKGHGYGGGPMPVQPHSQISGDKYPMRDFSNLSGKNSQPGMYGAEVPGLLTTQDAKALHDQQASLLAWDKLGGHSNLQERPNQGFTEY